MSLLELASRLDEPAIRALLAEAVGFPTAKRLEAIWRRYRDEPGWYLYGAKAAGAVVGCIGPEVSGPGPAVVRHIAVAPAARRQGLGRSLLRQAGALLGLHHMTAQTD